MMRISDRHEQCMNVGALRGLFSQRDSKHRNLESNTNCIK